MCIGGKYSFVSLILLGLPVGHSGASILKVIACALITRLISGSSNNDGIDIEFGFLKFSIGADVLAYNRKSQRPLFSAKHSWNFFGPKKASNPESSLTSVFVKGSPSSLPNSDSLM